MLHCLWSCCSLWCNQFVLWYTNRCFSSLPHLQPVESPELDIDDVALGLALVRVNATDATFLCPDRVAVLIEGNFVVDVHTLADAYVLLLGLIYALHLHYPKDLANAFDFIQKVLMGLEDGKLKPRVLSLKNDLLAVE